MTRFRDAFYYLFFLMLFGFRAIGGYDGWAVYRYTLLAGVLFFILKIASTSHTITEYLIIGVLLLLAGIVYLRSGEKGLLLDFMMMLGMKEVSEKRLFRLSAWFLGISMAVLVFLTVCGFLPDVQFGPHGLRLFHLVMMRRSLGYPHVNTLMTTYVILMMLVMYLAGNTDRKTVIRTSCLLFFGAVYLFLYCDSKTGILISTGYLVLNYLFQFRRYDGPLQKAMVYGLYPVINVGVFAGMIAFLPRDASLRVNSSFGERFRLAAMYWKEIPVTFFGSRLVIPLERGEDYGIDISQIYLFLNYGIVAFIVVTILYFLVIRDMFRMKNRGALAIIVTLMIMGVSDPLLYNLSCKNLTFLFMGMSLYRILSEAAEKRLPVSGKEICLLPFGDHGIPGNADACLMRIRNSIFRIMREGNPGRRGRLPAVLSACAAAALYAVCMRSRITPVMNSYEAGKFEYMRMTVTVAIFCFLAVSMIQHIAISHRR